jgi:hypothetical protein
MQFNVFANTGAESTKMYEKKVLQYILLDDQNNKVRVPVKASVSQSCLFWKAGTLLTGRKGKVLRRKLESGWMHCLCHRGTWRNGKEPTIQAGKSLNLLPQL